MRDEEIYQRICTVFTEEFEIDPEKLVAEATIFDELGLDSLDAVDMIVALEKEFGVRMRDEESMRAVRTMGDLVQLVLKTRDEAA